MSATVDANVLVYAANIDDPAHDAARTLLARLVAGPDLLYLFWPALMGFVRIATHPSILPQPFDVDRALQSVEALTRPPHVRTPGEGDGFLSLYRSIAGPTTRGNVVPDAHLAALMRQHGVTTIYTRDRDFLRFDGVRVIDPFR